jgi:phosphoserine phosphatase RsbU/P
MDDQLLQRLAAQIATRERHRHELEIAREVQLRLFPQDRPPVAGLQYAGACRPALEVGGDYYDFIPITSDAFGIAIGDVSGKGVPASLLMATVRAYLRGQTTGRTSNLPTLMSNLNRFVYDSSPANRYATFFYAEHDAKKQTLRYVNGGHNPPLLFRAAKAGALTRLDVGGPAIGMMPDCRYTQGELALDPGDLFVAFTDGISEATNRADEEWGESRLIEAIRAYRHAPPDALITRIFGAADLFVGDSPQHDDMTVVVLRVVG